MPPVLRETGAIPIAPYPDIGTSQKMIHYDYYMSVVGLFLFSLRLDTLT